MGFFERFRKNNNENTQSDWDSLSKQKSWEDVAESTNENLNNAPEKNNQNGVNTESNIFNIPSQENVTTNSFETEEEDREAKNKARQERKIIATLFASGRKNYNVINAYDVELPNEKLDREHFLEAVDKGEIGNEDFEEFLNQIAGPYESRWGFQNIKKINDYAIPDIQEGYRHQTGNILAHVLVDDAIKSGEENRENRSDLLTEKRFSPTANDVVKILDKYPTPLDFENRTEDFMTRIAENNPEQKLTEYKSALEELEGILYGKRFEYWTRIKGMKAEAKQKFHGEAESKKDSDPFVHFVPSKNRIIDEGSEQTPSELDLDSRENTSNDDSESLSEKSANLFDDSGTYYEGELPFVSSNHNSIQETINSSESQPDNLSSKVEQKEQEKTHEKFFSKLNKFFMSRKMVRERAKNNFNPSVEELNNPEADVTGEDTILEDEKHGIFGIFDGMGGHIGGKLASTTAAEAVQDYVDKTLEKNPDSAIQLEDALNAASEKVAETEGAGNTTGTIAHIMEQPKTGRLLLSYAQVGDSRLYLIHDGHARLLTEDEPTQGGSGLGNKLSINPCKQFGSEVVNEGDIVVMCSKGVSGCENEYGDTDSFMTNRELENIVLSKKVEDAAQALCEYARADADRSAIVFEVKRPE